MNNLSVLTAQPQKFVVDGKEYWLHPFDFNDWGRLQSWVDEQFPDPFDVVNKAIAKNSYTVAQQQFMIRAAIDKATQNRRLIGTPEADELLMSIAGIKQILLISIQKGDPSFTMEDAEKLYLAMSRADLAKMQEATTMNMVITDPKDPPLNIVPPRSRSGSATSRKRRAAKTK